MASLPSPTQVAGKHNAIFEAYYKQMDPKGLNTIEAMDAAKFLKKSGLSDVVLSRIWDLSEPKGRGCLDKTGFFVALKLVSLAQAGNDINMRNILMELPNPPKVGELPKIIPQSIQTVPPTNTDWSIRPNDRVKYETLFESLAPVNGMIPGNKVKGVLMDSKLPLETLGKIWDLADQDKDGNLDKHEFTVAMHLVYQALDKRVIPNTLPPELNKPSRITPTPPVVAPLITPAATVNDSFGDGGFVANFPKDIAPPPVVPPLPVIMTQPTRISPALPPPPLGAAPLISTDPIVPLTAAPAGALPTTDWVVTPMERIRYEGIFRDCDKDKDGLVSGLEVKNVFLQSGLSQNCLAHIWALCDSNESGKLTLEQFCLAIWLVEQKKKGIDPPDVLKPNMVPPSQRGAATVEMPVIQPEPKPTYSNPELEMISKEIEELARERRILETDIAQKEADIRIKSGEVRSLQSELDTLAATLKQLENQKGEAQKRLDDLKVQKIEVDDALASTNSQIQDTLKQVNKIREQCQKQEATINEQEDELNSKKSELQKLKDEESALEKEYETGRRELDNLSKQLQDTQLQISQVKAMVTQLLEAQRQMNDALLLCKAAIESNETNLISDYTLNIEPDFYEAKKALEKQIETQQQQQQQQQDAFGTTNAFDNKQSNGFESDPFAKRDATGFDDSFSNAPLSGFDDAFSGSTANRTTKDPFGGDADPFADKAGNAVTPDPGKDDFGSDPFAILHAPTSAGQALTPSKSGPPPRPESPSPALPPKKSKQPPPRPAPPRPMQGPTKPAPMSDSFASPGGFADFADFNKVSNITPPTQPPLATLLQKNQSSVRKEPAKNGTTTIGSGVKAPADFADDPFKDYRYEDPFSIKDPFDDDDDTGTCSEDNSIKDSEGSTLKSNNEDFQFTALSSDNRNDDFFNAFNDNFKSIDRKNTKTNQNSTFDAFGDSTTSKDNAAAAAVTTKSSKQFDAFNDNFEDDFFKLKLTDRNDNLKKSNDNFAHFGNFEDAFGAPSPPPPTSITLNNQKSLSAKNNNWNDVKKFPIKHNKNNNNNNSAGGKVSDKFAEDYSNDNFDADLQAVLQRSVVDK